MAVHERAAAGGKPTWDSLRRVRASLEHHEPDRVPLDIGGTRVTGIHLTAYARFRRSLGLSPSAPGALILYLQLARVDSDFRAALAVDLQSVDPLTSAFEGPVHETEAGGGRAYTDMWGCEWFMPPEGEYFDIRRFPLGAASSVAEIERYPWPRGDSPQLLAQMKQAAALSIARDSRAVVLGRTCPGVYEMCSCLCGHEKAMTDLAAEPALSEAIMERVLCHKLEYYRAAIEQLLAAGVPYFMVSESDDLGSQSGLLISPQMYRTLVKPRHKRLFSEIKRMSEGRAFIELHTCGAVRTIIPDLIEAGVEVLNPVQLSAAGMEPSVLKREFGSSIVFHGGGLDSQHTLPYGTPREVRDEVKRRIDELAPGGGFIFTPVHSIQSDVPEANFMAMLEAFYDNAGR
jgi:uroporphyrinogen decarboxylase